MIKGHSVILQIFRVVYHQVLVVGCQLKELSRLDSYMIKNRIYVTISSQIINVRKYICLFFIKVRNNGKKIHLYVWRTGKTIYALHQIAL